jgi:hypothetical protein
MAALAKIHYLVYPEKAHCRLPLHKYRRAKLPHQFFKNGLFFSHNTTLAGWFSIPQT